MSKADRIGAFFDLDGTLLAAPSVERRFIVYLFMRGLIGPAQFARWAAPFITKIARNPRVATGANKAHFWGVSTRYVEKWSTQFSSHPLKFLSSGLRRLESHFAQGHRIFLITGAPAPLAELVANYFPVPLTVVGTHLDVRDGLWTGKIAGEHMCGGAKQHAIIRLAAAHSLNLTRSFAYGDSVGDLPMLENVGYPAAVNPSKNLERAARIRNWPILRWRETQNVRGENLCDAARPLPLLGVNFMQFTNFPGRNR